MVTIMRSTYPIHVGALQRGCGRFCGSLSNRDQLQRRFQPRHRLPTSVDRHHRHDGNQIEYLTAVRAQVPPGKGVGST